MKKLLKLSFALLVVITFSSCVSSLPMNKQFYNTKKVGVIIQLDSIGMAKAGGQGLLDMALTSGNRFSEPLKSIEPQLKFKETLKSEITNLLNEKNKPFTFIDEILDYKNLDKYAYTNSEKKFNKYDLRKLKSSYNVDEILYVKVRYGLLVSYSGFIEIGKQGYVNMVTEITDLSDNSYLQQETMQTVKEIKGNWKKGEDFGNLKTAIQEAITSSIETLKTKF